MRNLDFFGPILVWEMMTVSRRMRYFVLRIAYVLFLLVLLWSTFQSTLAGQWMYGSQESMIARAAQFANRFFSTFSIAQISAILFLTPAYVASSIVIEKERRTIEYLFASSLTNREIVLGKWSARSLNLLMLILAGVPVLSFASFFGGIGLERIFLLSILSVATLLSTSALSLFASVYGRSMRTTLSNAYSSIILFLTAPLLLLFLKETVGRWLVESRRFPAFDDAVFHLLETVEGILAYVHPYYALHSVGSTMSVTSAAQQVFATLGIHAGIAVTFLFFSILRIRAAYRGQVSKGDGGSLGQKRAWPHRRTAPPVSDDPVFWKEWHFGGSRRRSLVWTLLFPFLVLGGYWYFLLPIFYWMNGWSGGVDGEAINIYLRTIGTLAVGLTLVVIAARGATSLSGERDKDTWLTLLSTPLSGSEIIWGKLRGALKPAWGYLLLVAPAWILAVFLDGVAVPALPMMLLATMAYCTFVASLGVYQSLRRKTTGSALAITFLTCALLGGFGHLLTGLFVFPLFLLGIEWEWLGMLYLTSVPWVVLASVPFRGTEIMPGVGEYIGCAVFWVLAYYAAAAFLYHRSVAEFDRLAPRGDGRQDGLPSSPPGEPGRS